MFLCNDCKKPIGPRVSPVLMVVDQRQVSYRNTDPVSWEVATTSGWEIAREVKLCRPCAKMEPVTPLPTPQLEIALAGAESRGEHARRCKKPLDDCLLCKGSIQWFYSLPPQTLARVLQDRGGNHSRKVKGNG